MASNSFGNILRITTWGESHGKSMGVIIDGCPPLIEISEEEIRAALAKRRPGNSPYTSPRKEKDLAEIHSGVFEGKTTGAPIAIVIPNIDAKSKHYDDLRGVYRPGHANYTYLEKYGIFDHRGGGRASARETACRVAAGAISDKILGEIEVSAKLLPLFVPIGVVQEGGDSIGGVVEITTSPLPVGLGDPVYEKLEANLAKALLSIPASKGVEFGRGFESARMLGSEFNDLFFEEGGKVRTRTNHSGGTLGGISNGEPLEIRVAFKPTSSINKEQVTVTLEGKTRQFTLPEGSRHDPCVAIRAVPVCRAMTSLVLADALLLQGIFQRDRRKEKEGAQ